MYPSEEFNYGGIFVKNQFNYLVKNFECHTFSIKAMKRKNTSFFGSMFKYIYFLITSFNFLFKKFDVLHIHYFSFHFVFAPIYKMVHPGTVIILTLHGSDVNMFSENKVFRKVVNISFKLLKVVKICVGKKLADNFFKKFYLKADYILPAGVNDEIFYMNPELKKEYDFTFVGSFSKLKGVDLILEAISKYNLDYKWCFIGSGPYLDELKNIQIEYNVNIFSGLNHKEIAYKLNQSKYFILPSRSEGFPLASLEALYCGVPVLCSNLDQFKEQVKDGENGFIIEASSSESIKNTIKKALSISEEEYKRLTANASFSNKEFTLKNVCNELIKIYKKASKK